MTRNADPETVVVKVGDAVVRCTLSGVEVEGADPIVLLPGVGGSTDTEFPFLLPMLARTARVVAVDLQYTSSDPIGLGSLAEQLGAAIRQVLPGRRVTLVGFSVGATVALAFASTSLQLSSLVLVTPVLKASERHRMFASLRSRLQSADPDAIRRLDDFAAHSPAFFDTHESHGLLAVDGDTMAKHHLFVSTDLTDTAANVAAPTLVIGASQDDLAGVEQSRLIFASLPNARYTEIDSGHAVLAERPAEVLALLREFAAHSLRHPPGSVMERARP